MSLLPLVLDLPSIIKQNTRGPLVKGGNFQKSIGGDNFWLECPTDPKSTHHNCISIFLFRDTHLPTFGLVPGTRCRHLAPGCQVPGADTWHQTKRPSSSKSEENATWSSNSWSASNNNAARFQSFCIPVVFTFSKLDVIPLDLAWFLDHVDVLILKKRYNWALNFKSKTLWSFDIQQS